MLNFFVCKIFVLKYFCGSWQPTISKHMKYILYTNIRAFNFMVCLPHEKILTMNFSQITTLVVSRLLIELLSFGMPKVFQELPIKS